MRIVNATTCYDIILETQQSSSWTKLIQKNDMSEALRIQGGMSCRWVIRIAPINMGPVAFQSFDQQRVLGQRPTSDHERFVSDLIHQEIQISGYNRQAAYLVRDTLWRISIRKRLESLQTLSSNSTQRSCCLQLTNVLEGHATKTITRKQSSIPESTGLELQESYRRTTRLHVTVSMAWLSGR